MVTMRSLAVLVLMLLALAACGSVRQSLGLGRNTPDEFAVADRPPLAMPPDFALRPPKPGAPRPQDIDQSKRANDILFSGNANPAGPADTGSAVSDAEKAILTATNAAKADPNIREIVDRENSQKASGSVHLLDRLLWWKQTEKPAATVDAAAEAARIKEAKEKGEPINQGPTPIIERQKSGWLGL